MTDSSRRLKPNRPACLRRRPLEIALSAVGMLLLTAACTAITPQCRLAMEARQRQETLAQQVSSGGIDPEVLSDARLQQRRNCGF